MATKHRSSFRVEPQPVYFSDVKKPMIFPYSVFIAQRQWYAYCRSFNRSSLSTRRSNPAHQWCPSLTISSILLWRQTYLPVHPLTNYHYAIITALDYKIRLARKGNILEINTSGFPWKDVYLKLNRQREFQSRIFKDAKTGYFRSESFIPTIISWFASCERPYFRLGERDVPRSYWI